MLTAKKAKKLVKKNILKCYRGAFVWHKILKQNPEISNTAVVLVPEINDDANYYALLYMDDFLNSTNRDNAVILTFDARIQKVCSQFSQRIIRVILLNQKEIEFLMQYMSLYCFDNRLVVASLDKPAGRDGTKLVGLKGLTFEEVFSIGVYGLYPFRKQAPVKWEADGTELDSFMIRE